MGWMHLVQLFGSDFGSVAAVVSRHLPACPFESSSSSSSSGCWPASQSEADTRTAAQPVTAGRQYKTMEKKGREKCRSEKRTEIGRESKGRRRNKERWWHVSVSSSSRRRRIVVGVRLWIGRRRWRRRGRRGIALSCCRGVQLQHSPLTVRILDYCDVMWLTAEENKFVGN